MTGIQIIIISHQRDKDTCFKNYEQLIISNQDQSYSFKEIHYYTSAYCIFSHIQSKRMDLFSSKVSISQTVTPTLESAKGKPERVFNSIHKISKSHLSTLHKPHLYCCPRKTCANSQLAWKKVKNQNVVTASLSRMGQKGALPSTAQWFPTSSFARF